MVEELSSYTPQDLADLDALMHELSATSFCNEGLLNNALNDANVHVYVIREEGHIVATGTLCIKHTLEFTIADIICGCQLKVPWPWIRKGVDDGYD